MKRIVILLLAAVTLTTAGCTNAASTAPAPSSRASASASPAGSAAAASRGVPRPAHVVIVVEENHSFTQTIDQPYLSQLAAQGATFTEAHAETHPSEPNYLALWSGSTHGVAGDPCPVDLGSAPSLGAQLLDASLGVAGYMEDLPSAGFLGCTSGSYARKHNPLADFTATSGAVHNKPFSAFPSDYAELPAVSLVVPNLDHDMHDGSVQAGDAWLRSHLGGYATWAQTHDSLLIVTFDEDERKSGNRILTVFTGQHVRPGRYGEHIDHYSVLHTIEAAFGLPQLGVQAAPITGVWR